MTKEEILALDPSMELGILVAREVMKWRGVGDHWVTPEGFNIKANGLDGWYPWRDISAAWQVAVKMGLAIFPLNNGDWAACKASHIYHLEVAQDHYTDPSIVVCYTAPEAICKAALLAKLEAS